MLAVLLPPAANADPSGRATRSPHVHQTLPFLKGVNLASGSFGRGDPRVYGRDYIYPDDHTLDYFASKGFNFVRLAFRWENLQPELQAALDPDELARITKVVSAATKRGLYVAVDPHNYARYRGEKIGEQVPIAAFADLWYRLAGQFRDNPKVFFDLMNEPHGIPSETVLESAQAAIEAIRSSGARNLILVEGTHFSNAVHWLKSGSDILARLTDPAGNLMFSPHQYLDADGSGTNPACVSERIGRERLVQVTTWARAERVRLVLGEFGAGHNPVCEAAVSDMLDFMRVNDDVWAGWAWWAGGPWWGSYFSSIEPERGVERPQMTWLSRYLQ